ncbi:MAG TPA: transporter substrate-binding domain-containing protein, partial [Stellaceae bacterium]|nr:transporter substrate-binding domain-containing protein [Stellaceae bacterium]
MPVTPSAQAIAELAPTGALRAAINMGNFLLVTGRDPSGDPSGVSPDIAAAVAARLGVPVTYVPYAKPGELADDAEKNLWDIGNIGAEPQRAEKIAFTAAYCEIEATYLVPPGSPIRALSEVDRPGRRIAVTARSAYCLWLENNLKNAQLLQFNSADEAVRRFLDDKMDAYAGLRPGLL